jgi:hypothetical protein
MKCSRQTTNGGRRVESAMAVAVSPLLMKK